MPEQVEAAARPSRRVRDVQGHRGGGRLGPENTIPGFLAGVQAGLTGFELDTRLTADGQVVVWHDKTLRADKCIPADPALIGARVDEVTMAQLRTVDVGSLARPGLPDQRILPGTRMSTLPEVLEACAEPAAGAWWTVEIKVDPRDEREVANRRVLVDGVLTAIHQAGIEDRCYVHSFDWAVLELARDLDPVLPRSALAIDGLTYAAGSAWLGSVRWEEHRGDLPSAAAAAGAKVVSPHHTSCDQPLVDRAHELGLGVLPWTVNDPSDLLRMKEIGVDGLVTDFPTRAVELLHDA
ncbi:MAG TPA: glycerophosphodiester phosphodiesterase family protein [Intrasporangium sp.]|uniref:glycerophosphodiester phosphodiesterase family protein n=1 Tax=Intrasporangium sp. TaxID=1925024 RepID=UPI002D78A6D4|nr:glycerophosphodiester phosphodiesterase family protein [Intrasporangium sp.]HET7398432.1 glycerophosphodiester phosphodiesterase family protein [Intrasporangium sp.]